MYKFLVALLFLVYSAICDKISAQLFIITYNPLYFNLTFSEPTPLPKFQVLFNQIPINYKIELNNISGSYYIIKGITEGIVNPADYITEKYVLMFTQPLTIAAGNLNLDSFLLRAIRRQNQTQYKYQPLNQWDTKFQDHTANNSLNILAIAIICITYFLAYTTFIGVRAYNFLGIYIFIALQSPLFTDLDYRIAYYLLFSVNQAGPTQSMQFLYMCIPFFLILFTFGLGLLSRHFLQKLASRSGLWNYVYYYLSYKLFIITWSIMCIPIYVNMSTMISKPQFFTQIDSRLVYFYIYFSAATIVFYHYMAFFSSNPQIGETSQKWNIYIDSSHYQLFEGFHLGSDSKDWKKRNFATFIALIRLIILIFVSAGIIGIPNLLLQIFYLIYLFTLRPFKYNFFNYFTIGIQIFVIVLYLYRYIVELYMNISDQITTSTDITRILLANIIFLSVITFSYFILGVYEFYQRLRSFRISMKSWRRQAKYGRNEQFIRKTKHSAFKNEEERNEKSMSKKSPKKMRKISDKQCMPPSKANYTGKGNAKRQIPQMKLERPLKTLNSFQQQSKQMKEIRQQNKSVSAKTNSPTREKPSRKLKQKSSLLQSISMGHQSP